MPMCLKKKEYRPGGKKTPPGWLCTSTHGGGSDLREKMFPLMLMAFTSYMVPFFSERSH